VKIRARWSHLRAAVTGRVGAMPVVRYAGAGYNRLMKGWQAYEQSADEALVCHLPTLRARARKLVEDNGEAAGLLLDFESDIVGAQGAILQFRATKKRGTPLDSLNDRIEAGFLRFGAPELCTLEGREDFASLSRLMIRTVIVDGEFFALRHRDPSLPHGYTLQPIDADQVDATYNVARNAAGVAIVMGVEVDRYGKPLGYWVWDHHPTSGQRGDRQRVDARDMLHVFKRLRVGQTRGIPWFAPAIVTWKLGDQYTESELVQSMLAAAQGGFFVNKDNSQSLPIEMVDGPNGTKVPKPLVMEVQPGVARQLPPGWEFVDWKPTHPTANYVGFMKAVKRLIARAFGRSYASLTGDLSDVNFSSMRTDRVREQEQNRLHQADLLVRQFCRVVFADWLEMAWLKGIIGVIPMIPSELAPFATWMCRGWPWVDPLKDAAAKKLELEMRITSPQILCAELGRDYFDVIDQIAEAQEYAEQKKVPLSAIGLTLNLTAGDGDDAAGEKPGRARPSLALTA
jgi:lambda family phage portal protein